MFTITKARLQQLATDLDLDPIDVQTDYDRREGGSPCVAFHLDEYQTISNHQIAFEIAVALADQTGEESSKESYMYTLRDFIQELELHEVQRQRGNIIVAFPNLSVVA